MLRLLADENFNGRIVRGLRQREPRLDLVTVQEAGLSGSDDPTVLAWAAREGRVLLTHDAATMSGFAYARVQAGLPMPGVFEVSDRAGLGRVIEDLLDVARLSFDGEYEGRCGTYPFGDPEPRASLTAMPRHPHRPPSALGGVLADA